MRKQQKKNLKMLSFVLKCYIKTSFKDERLCNISIKLEK